MAHIDTSTVDVYNFYCQYTTPVGKASNDRVNGREYHGACPFCGGVDRFAFWESGRFSCAIRSSGCGKYGDVIDFLKLYEGLEFHEACDRLGVDADSEYRRPIDSVNWREGNDAPPNKHWQEYGLALTRQAQRVLYSPRGADALAYLHARGLTDETIQRTQLGYLPCNGDTGRWYETPLSEWGLKTDDYEEGKTVKLPEGILLPYIEGTTLWKLEVRRFPDHGVKHKYPHILGSGVSLYNSDSIEAGKPVVLCEGVFDALAVIQETQNDIAVVATGSAALCRTERAIRQLHQSSTVLVAFDDDEPDNEGIRAGDNGASWWIANVPHAIRRTPWAHDINDMLNEGMNIREWIELGLASLDTPENPVPQHIKTTGTTIPEQPTMASTSLAREYKHQYTDEGLRIVGGIVMHPDYQLRLRDDGNIGLRVPDDMPDAKYQAIAALVEQHKESVAAYLTGQVTL